jgi:thioredoxin 1
VTEELTTQNFAQQVLQSNVPVLVDFWGPWCAPCNRIAPMIDRLGEEVRGKYRIGKINIAEQQDLTRDYGITAIPTLLIFKGGQVVRKFVGAQERSTLLRALAEVG